MAPVEKNSTASSTRLQIRLPSGGQPLVHAVESSATLGEVKSWVLEQTGLGEATFSSAFPRWVLLSCSRRRETELTSRSNRKTYGPGDESKTMTELGLAPSVSRCSLLPSLDAD